MGKALRPHQEAAIEMLRQSLRSGHRRPIIQAPTGMGKTVLAAAIISGALAKRKRVVFTVPAIELVDQTVVRLHEDGISDVGVIQADHHMTDWSRPVQVASVQTLARRHVRPNADIVVVDECHRAFSAIHEWMAQAPQPFVGLSATPWTKGLGRHWDDLIIASTTADLIETGYLSPFRVFAPAHPDLTGVKTVAGDYHEGQLAAAMDLPTITADVVSTWQKLGELRPTLCFGVNKAHALHLHDQFIAAGVPAAYVDDRTERADRAKIRKAFENGDVRVVCNIGVLTTGIDWDVRCIILARPTKSEILYTQIIGRGLRTAQGKDDLLILDHSNTTETLGFVTDICHESLDDGGERAKAELREKLPKICKACQFLKPAGVHLCPNCGFKPEPKDTIVCEEGELKQIKGKKKDYTMEEKQSWFSQLLWYREEYGYKEGWAANKYREKFGVWPNGLKKVSVMTGEEVGNYIRSSAIRWRKGQAKMEPANA